MGAAVIGKRHSGLFRDRTTAQAETAFPPNLAMNDSDRFHHQLLRCFQKHDKPRILTLLPTTFSMIMIAHLRGDALQPTFKIAVAYL